MHTDITLNVCLNERNGEQLCHGKTLDRIAVLRWGCITAIQQLSISGFCVCGVSFVQFTMAFINVLHQVLNVSGEIYSSAEKQHKLDQLAEKRRQYECSSGIGIRDYLLLLVQVSQWSAYFCLPNRKATIFLPTIYYTRYLLTIYYMQIMKKRKICQLWNKMVDNFRATHCWYTSCIYVVRNFKSFRLLYNSMFCVM